jgi:hypothetical protein
MTSSIWTPLGQGARHRRSLRGQSDLKQDNNKNHGNILLEIRIVKFLWAHANEKNQPIEIDKTTA